MQSRDGTSAQNAITEPASVKEAFEHDAQSTEPTHLRGREARVHAQRASKRCPARVLELTGDALRAPARVAEPTAGVQQLAEAFEKREEYGYWQARLKDSFHFDPIRKMARKRLEQAQATIKLLEKELKEDQP